MSRFVTFQGCEANSQFQGMSLYRTWSVFVLIICIWSINTSSDIYSRKNVKFGKYESGLVWIVDLSQTRASYKSRICYEHATMVDEFVKCMEMENYV